MVAERSVNFKKIYGCISWKNQKRQYWY